MWGRPRCGMRRGCAAREACRARAPAHRELTRRVDHAGPFFCLCKWGPGTQRPPLTICAGAIAHTRDAAEGSGTGLWGLCQNSVRRNFRTAKNPVTSVTGFLGQKSSHASAARRGARTDFFFAARPAGVVTGFFSRGPAARGRDWIFFRGRGRDWILFWHFCENKIQSRPEPCRQKKIQSRPKKIQSRPEPWH